MKLSSWRCSNAFPAWALPAVCCLTLLHTPVSAQTQADMAGIWNNILFSIPAQLTVVQATNGWVTDVLKRDMFDARAAQVAVQADGTFTGPATGSLKLVGPGTVQASVSGQDTVTFHVNRGGDFLFALKTAAEGRAYDLELLFKAPTTLATNDLTGTWRMFSLGTPALLGLMRNETNGFVSAIDGTDQFSAGTGVLDIAANGTFSGNFDGTFTGAFTAAGNGSLQATIYPQGSPGPMNLTMFVNRGKDLMATVHSDLAAGDNYQEVVLFVRTSTQGDIGDMKGLWHAGSMYTPPQLTVWTNNQGYVQGIANVNDFGITGETLNIGHTGFMLSSLEGGTGVAAVTAPGTVVATTTNYLGEVRSTTLCLNAARDVVIARTPGPAYGIAIGTRAPVLTGSDASAGLDAVVIRTGGEFTVCWPSDTNRFLASSSDLVTWTPVTNTLAESTYTIHTETNALSFYRPAQSQ